MWLVKRIKLMSLSLCYVVGEFFISILLIVWGIGYYDYWKSKKCEHKFVSQYYRDPDTNTLKVRRVCPKCGSVDIGSGYILTRLGMEYKKCVMKK